MNYPKNSRFDRNFEKISKKELTLKKRIPSITSQKQL